MDATRGSFTQGMRDGSPVYAVLRHPSTPREPSAAYGGGMALSGLGSIGLGIGAVMGAQALRAGVTAIPSGVHNGIFVAAALFAVTNVLLGAASAVQGVHYVLGGKPREDQPFAPGPPLGPPRGTPPGDPRWAEV